MPIRPWFFCVLALALPLSVSAEWPLVSQSTNYKIYDEAFDAGRTVTASANFWLTGVAASGATTGTSSTNADLYQGFYFTVYRDLNPPNRVTTMNAVLQASGNVALTWSAVTDAESGVWGYRVYRICYYGPKVISVRLVDAPDNSGTAFADTHGDELLYGIDYDYEVRPVDRALNEQQTNNSQRRIVVAAFPNSVTDLEAESQLGGDIRLTWSAVTGASHYIVYRSEAFSVKGAAVTAPGEVVQPSYIDAKTNLTGGRRYYYVVQAVVGGVEEHRGNNQSSAISDQGAPNAPVIYSGTHPVQDQEVANPNPSFYWIRSTDAGVSVDVVGYYVKLDQSETKDTPVSGPGWTFVTGVQQAYTQVANGRWVFHCRAKDQAGNLGEEAIYVIRILATGSITGQVTDASSQALSGVTVEAWLAGIRQGAAVTGADGRYTLVDVPLGTYTVKFNRFGYQPLEQSGKDLSLASTPLTVDQRFDTAEVLPEDQSAAYPNPAGGSEVRLIYHCAESCQVRIEIYNVAGERVGLIEEDKPAGYQYSVWPLHNVARGVYLFRVIQEGANGKRVLATRKFSVVK